MLHVEDLHWADDASIRLLADVLPELVERDLRVVVTYRPSEIGKQERLIETIEDTVVRRTLRLLLRPLSDNAIRSIVVHERGESRDVAKMPSILLRAAGNPFFALELSRVAGDGSPGEADASPAPSVRRVIQRRAERLDSTLRSLLCVASVAGVEADWEVVCNAAGTPNEQRRSQLKQLCASGMLVLRPGSPGERVVFSHVLFQEALYHSMSLEDRRKAHQRLANVLESLFGDDLESHAAELAYHYAAAEDHEAAARYLIASGDHLHAIFDLDGAVTAYTRAVDHLSHAGNVRSLRECWLRIASCHEQALDFLALRDDLEHVFALPPERSRPPSPGLRKARGEGYLRFATPGFSIGLDPFRSFNISSFIIHRQIYRPLVRYMPGGLIAPDAAVRWDISDDGLAYRFVIRDDAEWSDGAPLVAEDFARSIVHAIELLGNVETGAYIRLRGTPEFRASGDRSALALRCPEPKVLEFELEAPCPYLLHYFGLPYLQGLPSHLMDRWGDSWTEIDKFASSGPFIIDSMDERTEVHLVRNPSFTGRFTGNVAEALFVRCADDEACDRYESGIVDVYVAHSEQMILEAFRRCPSDLLSAPGQSVRMLVINPNSRALKRREARQALAHATDKVELMRLSGFVSVVPGTGGLIPPGVQGHQPGLGLPFDVARARELARKANLTKGTSLVFWTPSSAERTAEDASSSWERHLGVTTDLQQSIDEVFAKGPSEWPFDLALVVSWNLVPDPLVYLADENSMLEESLRQMFRESRMKSDPQKRLELIRRLDAAMIESAMWIPIFYPRGFRAARPWVENADCFPLFHGGVVDMIVHPH